jgi:Flp pilus assembly protein TadG
MRKYQNQKWSVSKNQRGATAVIVGASIFALVGIAALVVDLGNLYVALNELQNAADAGALAGARVLYNATGTAINSSANEVAYNVAKTNVSQNKSVDVNWTSGNDGDVQRGHWSFGRSEDLDKGFYPNNSCGLTDLWNVSFDVLDADTDFINAVRVVARRQATPVASFFARIFGYEGFEVSAEAVGYIGFSGKLAPTDVDQPIVICNDSILNNNNEYDCTIGRMLNSGDDDATNVTGGWTSFNQDDNPCSGTNSNELNALVCSGGNPETINLGEPIATTGGVLQNVFDDLMDCWEDETDKKQPWPLTLPVIDCSGANNVGTCAEIVGAVELNIIWIIGSKNYADAPIAMEEDSIENWPSELDITLDSGEEDSLYEFMKTLDDYSGVEDWNKELTKEFSDPLSDPPYEWYNLPLANFFDTEGIMSLGQSKAAGKVRWASFVRHFNLLNDDGTPDGTPAPYAMKSIYFLPDCTPHLPTGTSGGENFGKLARIPVLVH